MVCGPFGIMSLRQRWFMIKWKIMNFGKHIRRRSIWKCRLQKCRQYSTGLHIFDNMFCTELLNFTKISKLYNIPKRLSAQEPNTHTFASYYQSYFRVCVCVCVSNVAILRWIKCPHCDKCVYWLTGFFLDMNVFHIQINWFFKQRLFELSLLYTLV